MSRSVILNTIVILAVTVQVTGQFLDFFRLNNFNPQYQTTRRPHVTKKPTNIQTNNRFQDAIFFETDQFVKQRQSGTIDPFTTTSKPRRKPKTTMKPTRTPYQVTQKANVNYERTTIYNQDTRKINNQYNGNNNVYDIYNNYEMNNGNFGQTTEKPYNIKPKPNRQTTVNPLLYRPGVRPAAVDVNRPPITNRPVTNRPVYQSPALPERPIISRPPTGNDVTPEIEIGRNEDDMSEAEKRRFIEMSEQKCDEYKSMNTKKIVALPLATIHGSQGVELNVSTCTPVTIPLIIGGKPVNIKEFPHMGIVGWKNIQKVGYSWKCGGSLISEQFLLTAGHCTYHDKDYNVISGPPSAVQLGSSYIDGQDSLVVSISTVVRHPKYKLRRSYYDVALIKLVTTVTFTESISPACLGVPPPVGDSIIATGWGRTEFGGDTSKDLRSVAVSVWGLDECREVWGPSRKMPEGPSPASQLCAGVREGGKDTCQGDSGGPVQIQDGCAWRVVGVTSVGRACGAVDTPALYARLPRAFIAAQVFAHVQPNNQHNGNNNGNNWNDNGNNGNNNGNNGNNWNDNRFNNQDNQNRDEISRPGNHQNNNGNNWNDNKFNNQDNENRDEIRPGNHQTVGTSWAITSNNGNQFSDSFGSDRDVSRPGNHQTVNNNAATNYNNQFVSSQNTGNTNTYRPGNHQIINSNNKDISEYYNSQSSVNNRDETIRPGNHQMVNNNGYAAVNYFVTSQTSGNRDTGGIRPGNHQTVDKDTTAGNNYFVTSHTSGNNRGTAVRLPGNHQTLVNNNNGAVSGNNGYGDSQNSESNHDAVYNVRQEHNDYNNANNQNAPIYNSNNQKDNVNSNTWATNNARPTNNQYNNEQNSYYNGQNNRNTQNSGTYSNYGSQNSDYGTTESVSYNKNNNGYNDNNNGYNDNNNGYNVNNNREVTATSRPWWNR